MKNIADFAIPLVMCLILGGGLIKGVPVFDVFLEGAIDGLKIVLKLTPTLIALLTAISMLRASGAIELFAAAASPVTTPLGIPPEILPLAILRPISGSGSISLLADIIKTCGADSLAAKMACTVCASTETTLYTIAVYYGSVKVSKTRYTLPAALIADFIAFVGGCFFVRLLAPYALK